jgi:quercetin dioxygenase-like cupin family protein
VNAYTHGGFDGLPEEEVYEGVRRRGFSTERATVTRYAFAPGARFPLHRHPSEQVTLVESGAVEFTAGDETMKLDAGAWSVVGPGVEHGVRAGSEGAVIVAVVMPPRTSSDDYEVIER